MKKNCLLALSLCLCMFLCSGCIALLGDTESDTSTASTDSTTPADSEDTKSFNGEGDIGDCHIKIASAKKGKDYEGKNVLIVTYEWTNNADEEKMFSTTFSANAYQNGVECGDITIVDGVDSQKLLSKIKPGVSLEVQEAYVLTDDSDVTIEVAPWVSLGNDTKVTKTFSVK